MTAATPAAAPEWDRAPLELPQRTRIEIFIVVLLGIFLAALDQTIVGTALPVIVTDLKGNDVYIWAFTSYLLTATVSGPLYGKLSDLFGRRVIFMIGVSIFLIGSVLCATSGEMWQFIALPRDPGTWRRRALPGFAGDHRRHLRAVGAGQVPGLLRRHVRHLIAHRPGHRRDPDRYRRLALDLPRQPAARPGRPVRHLAHAADPDRDRRPERRSTTWARRSSLRPWCRS